MTDHDLDQDDLRVFRVYGRTMYFVQYFELALKQLVQLQTEIPEELSFEDTWARFVDPVLHMTAGGLAWRLDVPEGLAEEVQIAVNTRNTLAHEYLVMYRIERATRGDAAVGEAVAVLDDAAGKFRQVTAQIEAASDHLLERQGIDPEKPDATASEQRELWVSREESGPSQPDPR